MRVVGEEDVVARGGHERRRLDFAAERAVPRCRDNLAPGVDADRGRRRALEKDPDLLPGAVRHRGVGARAAPCAREDCARGGSVGPLELDPRRRCAGGEPHAVHQHIPKHRPPPRRRRAVGGPHQPVARNPVHIPLQPDLPRPARALRQRHRPRRGGVGRVGARQARRRAVGGLVAPPRARPAAEGVVGLLSGRADAPAATVDALVRRAACAELPRPSRGRPLLSALLTRSRASRELEGVKRAGSAPGRRGPHVPRHAQAVRERGRA